MDDFHLGAKSSDEEVILVHMAHNYVDNPGRFAAFHSALIYDAGLSLLWRLCEIYETLNSGHVATFLVFMETSVKVMRFISQT